MRVYLIDGYSLLYRAFYALPQSISTTSGLPTNALYGFTSMLLKLLSEEDEEVGLGVVWDAGKPAFRMEIFPEYKAQRSSMPEELKAQLDHLDQILEAMNIPAIRAEGFEADDVLATLSKRLPEGLEDHARRLGAKELRARGGNRGVRRNSRTNSRLQGSHR